jgi:hypothetical protein
MAAPNSKYQPANDDAVILEYEPLSNTLPLAEQVNYLLENAQYPGNTHFYARAGVLLDALLQARAIDIRNQ